MNKQLGVSFKSVKWNGGVVSEEEKNFLQTKNCGSYFEFQYGGRREDIGFAQIDILSKPVTVTIKK